MYNVQVIRAIRQHTHKLNVMKPPFIRFLVSTQKRRERLYDTEVVDESKATVSSRHSKAYMHI